MTECPQCGGTIEPGDRFCGACGREVDPSRVCAECGRPIEPGDDFCGWCGASLASPSPDVSEPPVRSSSPVPTGREAPPAPPPVDRDTAPAPPPPSEPRPEPRARTKPRDKRRVAWLAGAAVLTAVFAVIVWLSSGGGTDENGARFPVSDPSAPTSTETVPEEWPEHYGELDYTFLIDGFGLSPFDDRVWYEIRYPPEWRLDVQGQPQWFVAGFGKVAEVVGPVLFTDPSSTCYNAVRSLVGDTSPAELLPFGGALGEGGVRGTLSTYCYGGSSGYEGECVQHAYCVVRGERPALAFLIHFFEPAGGPDQTTARTFEIVARSITFGWTEAPGSR